MSVLLSKVRADVQVTLGDNDATRPAWYSPSSTIRRSRARSSSTGPSRPCPELYSANALLDQRGWHVRASDLAAVHGRGQDPGCGNAVVPAPAPDVTRWIHSETASSCPRTPASRPTYSPVRATGQQGRGLGVAASGCCTALPPLHRIGTRRHPHLGDGHGDGRHEHRGYRVARARLRLSARKAGDVSQA